MDTSKLSAEEFIKKYPKAAYLSLLRVIKDRMTASRQYILERGSYNDREWVAGLYDDLLMMMRDDRPLRYLAARLARSLMLSKELVWRYCLVDDLISLLDDEIQFHEYSLAYSGFEQRLLAMAEKTRKMREEYGSDFDDHTSSELNALDSELTRSLQGVTRIKEIAEAACADIRELRRRLLKDFCGGSAELVKELEEDFSCTTDSAIAQAVALRSMVILDCSRNNTDDVREQSGILRRYREAILESSDESADVAETLVSILRSFKSD